MDADPNLTTPFSWKTTSLARVGQSVPKVEPRLLGTWKSDRRRTFRFFKPKRGCSPQSLRKFKAIFGKLVIRYTRRKYYTELDGYRDSGAYEIVAADSESVVIRFWSRGVFSEGARLQHIHFEGDFYWIAVGGGGLCEFFRKVADADERKMDR
jgi:hypothetical protein